jgi:hypothetical protein
MDIDIKSFIEGFEKEAALMKKANKEGVQDASLLEKLVASPTATGLAAGGSGLLLGALAHKLWSEYKNKQEQEQGQEYSNAEMDPEQYYAYDPYSYGQPSYMYQQPDQNYYYQ